MQPILLCQSPDNNVLVIIIAEYEDRVRHFNDLDLRKLKKNINFFRQPEISIDKR